MLGTGHAGPDRHRRQLSRPATWRSPTSLPKTREAIADGADEIDLVIPYHALIAGNEKAVTDMVAAVQGRVHARRCS